MLISSWYGSLNKHDLVDIIRLHGVTHKYTIECIATTLMDFNMWQLSNNYWTSVLFLQCMIVCYIYTVQPAILQNPALGTHKYVTANGIKFHYVANGIEGKPLMLFLHGYPEVCA